MPSVNDAIGYAERGWSVLPLSHRGKTPATENGVKDATTDVNRIERWWGRHRDGANIGVATGRVSGIVVVDIDGPEGRESWKALTDQHGYPFTLAQITGREDGGQQLFFRYPADLELPARIPNRAGLRPGIDVRGDGGYVVVPPSVHPSGARYRWEIETEIAELPRWLRKLVVRKARPAVQRPVRDVIASADASDDAKRLLEEAADWLRKAGDGQRHQSRKSAGHRLGRLVGGGFVELEEGLDYLVAVASSNSRERTAKIRQTLREMAAHGVHEPWEAKERIGPPPPSDDDAPPWAR